MGPKLLRIILGVAGFTSATLPLASEPTEPVSLTIRFANTASTFQVGEVIPVELLYTSSTPGKYQLDFNTWGRTDPAALDSFTAIPQGRDPLFLYLTEIHSLFCCGGITGSAPLNNTPKTISETLSQWIVFDHPGHYQVQATSRRVTPSGSRQPMLLTSRNTLDLTIAPADPAWQRATLSAAVASLDRSVYNRNAQQSIRFLETAESIRELTHRLTQPGSNQDDWNYTAGLMGARDQPFVVRELQARWEEPDAALTRRYIWLLARLVFVQTHGQPGPEPTNDSLQCGPWNAQRKERQLAMQAAEDQLWKQVAAVLPRKAAAAREETQAELTLSGRLPLH